MRFGRWPFDAILAVAPFAGAASFLLASILVWFNPRRASYFAVFAAVAIAPWLVVTELLMFSQTVNSWILLDGPDHLYPGQTGLALLGDLRITSTALIVFAAGCASFRVLPARVMLGKSPLNQQTWPALAVAAVTLVSWFVHSAIPYRIPIIAHGGSPELRIVHLEKRGFRIRGFDAGVFRDGKVYLSQQDDRRLFRYRFHLLSFGGSRAPSTT